jgi:hypothetical protein
MPHLLATLAPSHHVRIRQKLTQLLEHLVAFVQDKVLQVLEVEDAVANQGQDAPGRPDDDVRRARLE